jgi:signal transduction histidine kinase/CheY-like chemotaxis protein
MDSLGAASATALVRSRSEELLRAAAAVLPKTGDEFLPAVVEQVAVALKAEVVMVGEYAGSGHVRSVSLWHSGAIVDNVDYALPGTPCEQVAGRPLICYPTGVQRLFPADEYLRTIDVDGYIAVPLVGTKGIPIGILSALTRDPIADEAYAASVLQLFAGRAAAEMQRTITERDLRKSEEHLLQVQRVEAIGRLAGNIAHDFNNLLMIVIGYAEMLRTRVGPSSELTELLMAADRATTLTRQLLAFGRRQDMRVQRLDLNRVVSQVQTMISRVIGAQVELTATLAPVPGIEADPGQLEQVLVNLAINARDAMPEGGTLHISTSVEEVVEAYDHMPAGRYVCLNVSDTGSGMTPEILAQIFEPYFTTKGAGGTGLGLSSVYGIIKQTGGFIWCQSEPGVGTTFKIYLRPAGGAVAPSAPAPDAAAPQVAGGVETILVVDDERAVRELLVHILRGRGYHVLPATDATTALDVLENPAYDVDLVVSDIVMPGMSGTRLVEDIQRRWPSIKLLLVSGHSQGVALKPDSTARTVPLLGKPFLPARLEAIVRDILDGAEVRRSTTVQPE